MGKFKFNEKIVNFLLIEIRVFVNLIGIRILLIKLRVSGRLYVF